MTVSGRQIPRRTPGGVLGVILACALLPALQCSSAADGVRDPLIVFAAASLTDVLERASAQYTQSSGVQVRLSFAASSTLARQIESGARADVFLSADEEWMDYLELRSLIDGDSRTDLLGNRLALVAPRDSNTAIRLGPDAPILPALGRSGRLAVADPDSVPAGRYAKSALQSLHLWDGLKRRLARAENVRVALMYVARGEAPLGIVYATDVAVEPRVRVVDVFPQSSHAPITYPAALTKTAAHDAASFMSYLRSDAARSIFVEAGFTVIAGR